MSGDCAEIISSGKAFQCLMTSMKYDDLCAWVGTNGVNSWTEFEFLGDVCGWDADFEFNFCMRLRIDSAWL